MKSLIKLINPTRRRLIAIGLCLFLPLTIQAQLDPFPIYDRGETHVQYIDFPGDVASGALSNREINNVLYTLNDDDTEAAPDGYVSGVGLVINSTMTDEQMATVMELTPGTEDYATKFKGITILLPRGNGRIVTLTKYSEGHRLCVKVGNQDPNVFIYDNTSRFHTYHNDKDYQRDTVEYALDVPTYVYIYHQNSPSQSRRMTRKGPKDNVYIALDELSVWVNETDKPMVPPESPRQLTSADVADAIANIPSTGYTGGELIIKDVNVTSLADDVFDGLEGKVVTYVNLSGTSINDMTVDRMAAPFNKIPATAFIYLPAGNHVVDGTTNVVIGTVCQNMKLYDGDQPFKAAKIFRAAHFEYDRDFSDFNGKCCSIYLPFKLKQKVVYELGSFYDVFDIDEYKVRTVQVGDTDYNKPYIFMPSSGTDFIRANMVDVMKKTGGGISSIPFEGTYEYKTLNSNDELTYYCLAAAGEYAGQFVRVTENVTVSPFRAYIILKNEDESASRSELSIDWGENGPTVLEPYVIDKTDARACQGWYSLSGMKLKSKPTKKGSYIHNGKKIAILK